METALPRRHPDLQSVFPLAASNANIVGAFGVPSMDGAYTTPSATARGPSAIELFGTDRCQRIVPVSGSSAAQDPALPALYEIPLKLTIPT